MTSATKMILPQNFDFFLVLDFEATCERNTRIEPQVKKALLVSGCDVVTVFCIMISIYSGFIEQPGKIAYLGTFPGQRVFKVKFCKTNC